MRDFVADPVDGMQAYTQRLLTEVAKLNTLSLSEQQLIDVAATVGLPRYIFSGVQQVHLMFCWCILAGCFQSMRSL